MTMWTKLNIRTNNLLLSRVISAIDRLTTSRRVSSGKGMNKFGSYEVLDGVVYDYSPPLVDRIRIFRKEIWRIVLDLFVSDVAQDPSVAPNESIGPVIKLPWRLGNKGFNHTTGMWQQTLHMEDRCITYQSLWNNGAPITKNVAGEVKGDIQYDARFPGNHWIGVEEFLDKYKGNRWTIGINRTPDKELEKMLTKLEKNDSDRQKSLITEEQWALNKVKTTGVYKFLGERHRLPKGPYPYWEQCGHLPPKERIAWANSNKSTWAMSDIGLFVDSKGAPMDK